MRIKFSAFIIVEVPWNLLRWSNRVHITNGTLFVWWMFLFGGTSKHWNDTHDDLRCLEGRCPVFRESWQADVAVRIHMVMNRWAAYKHDLRSFKRVLVIELELKRVVFTHVDCAFRHSKADSPDRVRAIYYFKLHGISVLCPYVLSFFSKARSTLHLNF